MLTYRGVDAWLEDIDGRELDHGVTKYNDDQVQTQILLEDRKLYTFRWRRSPVQSGPALSAWCEIFTQSHEDEQVRAATHFMDKKKAVTQSRSSNGRLDGPSSRDGHLETPQPSGQAHEKFGSVCLEIRRAQGAIKNRCIKDPKHPDGPWINETDIDIVDDAAEGKGPWIRFLFEFTKGPTRILLDRRPLSARDVPPIPGRATTQGNAGNMSSDRDTNRAQRAKKRAAQQLQDEGDTGLPISAACTQETSQREGGKRPRRSSHAQSDSSSKTSHETVLAGPSGTEGQVDILPPSASKEDRVLTDYKAAVEERDTLHRALALKTKAITKNNEDIRRLLSEEL